MASNQQLAQGLRAAAMAPPVLPGNAGLAGALRAYHGSPSRARTAGSSIDMPTAPNKTATNVLASDAENLSKLAVSNPLFVKGAGSVDVKARADVLPVMRRLLNDREVAQSVVGLVPVDVMDMLVGKKLSPEALLDNPTMLVDLLPVSTDDAVSGGVKAVDILAPYVALATAKSPLAGADAALALEKAFAASGARANDVHIGKIPRPLDDGKPLTKAERAEVLAQHQDGLPDKEVKADATN